MQKVEKQEQKSAILQSHVTLLCDSPPEDIVKPGAVQTFKKWLNKVIEERSLQGC